MLLCVEVLASPHRAEDEHGRVLVVTVCSVQAAVRAQVLLEKNGSKELLVDAVETDSLSVRHHRVSASEPRTGEL